MHVIRQVVIIILLALALTSVVFAGENELSDPRLDKQITLELGNVSLDELAAEVSKQTGIAITAGRGRSDWKVKERRTIIFAKDIKASDVLYRVASLHRYRLSRSGKEGEWGYYIWQDKRARDQEIAAVEEKISETAKLFASLSGAAAKMTTAQLTELEKKEPYKRFLLTDPLGKAICDTLAQIPQQARDRSGFWTVPGDTASPALRQAAALCAAEIGRFNIMTEAPKGVTPEDLQQSAMTNLYQVRVKPFNSTNLFGEELRQQGYVGFLVVTSRQNEKEYKTWSFLCDPNSSQSRKYVNMAKAFRSGTERRKIYGTAEANFMNSPIGELDSIAGKDFDDDPIFSKEIELKGINNYTAALNAIYKETEMNVLSDSYREKPGAIFSGKMKAKHIIAKSMLCLDKEPKLDGNVIVMRDKLCFDKRSVDISEDYLAALKKKAEEEKLGYRDYEQIALDLTDAQILGNLIHTSWFKGNELTGNLNALRFFGKLTPQQIKAMSDGSQLPIEMVAPDVMAYAFAAGRVTTRALKGKQAFLTNYQLFYDSTNTETGALVMIAVTKNNERNETVVDYSYYIEVRIGGNSPILIRPQDSQPEH